MLDHYVVEYNVEENEYQIRTVQEMIIDNLRIASMGMASDFMAVGFSESEEGAKRHCEMLIQQMPRGD